MKTLSLCQLLSALLFLVCLFAIASTAFLRLAGIEPPLYVLHALLGVFMTDLFVMIGLTWATSHQERKQERRWQTRPF